MYQGHRIIATDPSVIPLWSIVKITTDNDSFTAISLDTGGGINGKEIDFLVSSEREAINIGRKIVSVELVRKGK
jgi:3D (Asp-Asp-Asp) domain-containing protein